MKTKMKRMDEYCSARTNYSLFLFSTILSLLLLSSCVAVNTIHDGRTLGKDNSELAFIANTGDTSRYVYNHLEDSEPDLNLELDFTYGVTEKVDAGFKINLSGTTALNVKYQVAGNKTSTFASSLSLETGVNLLEPFAGDGLFYGAVLNYNSIHFSDQICLIFNPAYIYSRHTLNPSLQNISPSTSKVVDNYHAFLYSYGVIIGKTFRVGFEVTNSATLLSPQQFGISFSYVFGINEQPKKRNNANQSSM